VETLTRKELEDRVRSLDAEVSALKPNIDYYQEMIEAIQHILPKNINTAKRDCGCKPGQELDCQVIPCLRYQNAAQSGQCQHKYVDEPESYFYHHCMLCGESQ